MAFEVLAPIILFLVTLAAYALLWRKNQDQTTLLQDANARLETGRVGYNALQADYKQIKNKLDNQRALSKDLESSLAAAKRRLTKLTAEEELARQKLTNATKSPNWKLAHLEEENSVLKSQLIEKDREMALRAKAYKEQLAAQKKSAPAPQKAPESHPKDAAKMREDAKKIAILEKRVAYLTGLLKKVDLKEHEKNKRKVKHLEQLLASMKGLKELSDERNKNWQVALERLSCHVLGRKQVSKEGIGSLVGEALEKIGTCLVEDSLMDEQIKMRELQAALPDKQTKVH